MFRALGFLDLRGLAVKLLKFPLLSMVNPTAVPEFEMPFRLVPAPAFVPASGPSKLVNTKPPELTLPSIVMVGPFTCDWWMCLSFASSACATTRALSSLYGTAALSSARSSSDTKTGQRLRLRLD